MVGRVREGLVVGQTLPRLLQRQLGSRNGRLLLKSAIAATHCPGLFNWTKRCPLLPAGFMDPIPSWRAAFVS